MADWIGIVLYVTGEGSKKAPRVYKLPSHIYYSKSAIFLQLINKIQQWQPTIDGTQRDHLKYECTN